MGDTPRRDRIRREIELQKIAVAGLLQAQTDQSLTGLLMRAGQDLEDALVWLDVKQSASEDRESDWLLFIEGIVESAASRIRSAEATLKI